MTRIADEIGVPSAGIEDVIQDAWLKAVENRQLFHGVDGEYKFSAWLRRVVRNKSVDEIRRLDLRQTESLNGSAAEAVDIAGANRANATEDGEWLKALMDRLAEHHAEYHWVLCERFLKGRSIEEMAAEKGVTKHAISCLKTRALRELHRLTKGNRRLAGERAEKYLHNLREKSASRTFLLIEQR